MLRGAKRIIREFKPLIIFENPESARRTIMKRRAKSSSTSCRKSAVWR